MAARALKSPLPRDQGVSTRVRLTFTSPGTGHLLTHLVFINSMTLFKFRKKHGCDFKMRLTWAGDGGLRSPGARALSHWKVGGPKTAGPFSGEGSRAEAAGSGLQRPQARRAEDLGTSPGPHAPHPGGGRTPRENRRKEPSRGVPRASPGNPEVPPPAPTAHSQLVAHGSRAADAADSLQRLAPRKPLTARGRLRAASAAHSPGPPSRHGPTQYLLRPRKGRPLYREF